MNKDWEFVSKGTEISLGKFVPEQFTPLTLNLQTGVVSTEDTEEPKRVKKSFCLSRSDGWVMNRKMKKIVLLGFKRTSDAGVVGLPSYFQDMWKVTKKQHTPILTVHRVLVVDG